MSRISVSGNASALFGVFFDSFAKIAISVSVLTGMAHLDNELIYQRIMPALCSALAILSFIFYWQAKMMSQKLNYKVTAMPSGLQASCVFVWLFAIILPVAAKTHNTFLAYQVAVVANFINALIFIVSGILLQRFKHLIPLPALMGGLAGTAFTWLTVNNIGLIFSHPVSGVIPLFLLLILFVGGFRVRISPVMLGIILGSVLAISLHEITPSYGFSYAFNLPTPMVNGFMDKEVFCYVEEYLPLIAAFAIIDAMSAMQALEESRIGGEAFNGYITILLSGLVSGASALFGNPFAMSIFFGHSSWKKMHADYNYAFWLGVVYLATGLFGLVNIIIAVIPDWVTLPVLIYIGISTTALSFAAIEQKYYSVLVIGIVPILVEMIYNKLDLLASDSHLISNQLLGGAGLAILAKGSVLFSMGFAGILIYLMQRRWFMAAIYSCILLFLSIIGFIHADKPGLYLHSQMNIVYISLIIFCLGGYFLHRKQV